ncbi:flagellar basal body rod protein FlgC [Desulfurivibrio dismutans]|uniref:flagellar basal body rod protein FlgC n=1 Tax=Desulfurivibrio dismutans TaxID=1398908 RepID=UPI0023DCB423|nr:flagellar basal body rod protein FlgC [Desulfurivibrio alkaliphilus]MDF1614661.1 flagellar basal body rod protein FlgC [Desulfurivibrio alkaliphilus]
MDILTAMKISGSALKAERSRLNIASMNLANANTTRTMEGGPYRAKSVVFEAKPLDRDFGVALQGAASRLRKVEVAEVVEDQAPFREVYDPTHPDADESGIVLYPNVNVAEQMVDMMNARRSYEANVAALDAVKEMAARAMDISR